MRPADNAGAWSGEGFQKAQYEGTIMDTDESIFDYLAAAEETAKQFEAMTKRLPGELKAVLAEEWRKSPWLADLPKAMDAARRAAEKMENATRFLTRSVKKAGIAVCLAAVVIPLATWAWAYWNVSDLRRDRLRLERENDDLNTFIGTKINAGSDEISRHEREIATLSATLKALKDGTGGGIELIVYKGGAFGIILPEGMEFQHEARIEDNRNVLVYR